MSYLGVTVAEQATSVAAPRKAAVGIPYFVGTAPVHMAKKAAPAMRPVLAKSWDEAVEKLGYSEDWKKYTLCEAMYSHFQLYGCQPAIFCNVLDPARMIQDVAAKEFTVVDHRAALPEDATLGGKLIVKTVPEDGTEAKTLTADTDYSAFYDGGTLALELLEDGAAYDAKKLSAAFQQLDPGAVEQADIVEGVGAVDLCMSTAGVVPDLLLAPGWSHDTTVAAVLATKAETISGLFKGKALIDIDTSADGVREYSGLTEHKNKNNFVDPAQILCWPMVKLGEHMYHLSTQLAGLMAAVDTDNKGIPYESPSSKNLKIDGCCLADGTEVFLTCPQADLIAGGWGIVTALNFPDMGWIAKGNYTACFPGNTDVKDQFIPVSRMFDFIGNTLVRTFWPQLDRPMTAPLLRSMVQSSNGWLVGLVGSGYLYGARAEILANENDITELLQGHIKLHVYNAPPVPMQKVDVTLEYDVSYAETAIQI